MTSPPAKNITLALELLVPLIIVAAGTVYCLWTDFDLALSRQFFDPERQTWTGSGSRLIVLSYTWGPLFSGLAAFWALFHFFASYMHPRFWAKRAVSLFILLCIVVGPVLVVNGIVKESWRRPRPRDIVEFGGSHPHRKVLEFGNRDYRGKSFPGGHASAGFVLVLFYFLLKGRKPPIPLAALLFAVGWGTWISYVRIALGGHFFSDNLYAFGLNWYVVLALYYKWYLPYTKKRQSMAAFQPSRRRYVIGICLLLIAAGLLTFRFLFSAPFHIDYPEEKAELPPAVQKLQVRVRAEKGDILVRHSASRYVAVQTWISGHALPDIQAKRNLEITPQGSTWKVEYTVEPDGFYYEYQSHSYIYVPQDIAVEWDLFTRQGAVIWENRPRKQ